MLCHLLFLPTHKPPQAMLEDKLRHSDWDATCDAIEEAVARESYLTWLKENERRTRSGVKHSASQVGAGSPTQLCYVAVILAGSAHVHFLMKVMLIKDCYNKCLYVCAYVQVAPGVVYSTQSVVGVTRMEPS